MTLHALFPTLVYAAALQRGEPGDLNLQLLKECRQLRLDDAAGRRWSKQNYPGGYTSYGSVHRLQTVSPTFATLRRKLQRHVAAGTSPTITRISTRRIGIRIRDYQAWADARRETKQEAKAS